MLILDEMEQVACEGYFIEEGNGRQKEDSLGGDILSHRNTTVAFNDTVTNEVDASGQRSHSGVQLHRHGKEIGIRETLQDQVDKFIGEIEQGCRMGNGSGRNM